MVIASSASEARAWAEAPGVTHVSAQITYGGPAAPLVPFSALPTAAGWSGGGDTTPDALVAPVARTATPSPTTTPTAPAAPEPVTPAPAARRRVNPFFAPQ